MFSNVVSNAIQEMPDGGTLDIRMAARALGPADVSFDAGDRSGSRFRAGDTAVLVTIRDTGGGIPPENLPKVFEPFFSTKPTGKGMGLGLTVARKFVELHSGTITVQNHPDGGAVVTIMFKAA